ncbi:MAG: Ada metal-binding domain-containing protein [Bdellovibrionota bacterium]
MKRIIARRDRRFDGRFFFGVRTTKIYCRPICPAQPKPDNIILFRSATEAENAGFRACRRCRPELAPGNKLLDGTLNTVSRALAIIADHADEDLDIEGLAEKLGVSDRHLRRLFHEHLGASPIEILLTRRLHLAKQLLQCTNAPIADIAFASGFQSLRRFNEVCKARFQLPPSKLRNNVSSRQADSVQLELAVRPPYDWKQVIGYLERHETFGIEQVKRGVYRRFVPERNAVGVVSVSYKKQDAALAVKLENIPLTSIRSVLSGIRRLFDTDHDPASLPRTKAIASRGIRVPGAYDPFETAVSIVLSQLVSTEHARAKLKQLVLRFGDCLDRTRECYRFPAPSTLEDAEIEAIGIPRARASALRGLAQAVAAGMVDFRIDTEAARSALSAIHGIGPWTSAMIAMRCFGDPDAFPSSDLVIGRALSEDLVPIDDWRSYRAYLSHCLWRDCKTGRAPSPERRRG